jgi:transcriptional regulator of acetoin/glycerol metabolism
MERLAIMVRGTTITSEAITAMFQNREFDIARHHSSAGTIEEPNEKKQIIAALRAANFNQTEAARQLGIDRSTLYRKMKRYAIEIGLAKK